MQHGLVLGPLLFICVNAIENDIDCNFRNFQVMQKLTGLLMLDETRVGFQSDLNKMSEWSEEWQMKFSLKKCGVCTPDESLVSAHLK